MKLTPHLIILVFLICIAHSSIISDVKDNVLDFILRSVDNYKAYINNRDNARVEEIKEQEKDSDVKKAQAKSKIMKRIKEKKGSGDKSGKRLFADWKLQENTDHGYRIDPVLNYLARRSATTKKPKATEAAAESSSSLELQNWKDEWREHWIQKKFEAINSSVPVGDTVNMLAARPWGVPCGDPNQHDMPWGTCMLPMACESEYRIYRGDYFCGRTQFVCCALQLSNYDMYQGFDVSFADSELKTDSEEVRHRNAGSKEMLRKKKLKEKRRRARARLKRKRRLKKNIRKIIKEIRKILSRSYRNGTTARKRKTKQLKKYVKYLKSQYKKDRKSVKGIHEIELLKIDAALQRKLDQIRGLNQNFIRNYTFRDIVVNGTVSPKAMRMLAEAYPELIPMLDATRRRSDVQKPDYLEYDVEYGHPYY